MGWLIRRRWLAIAGVAVAIVTAKVALITAHTADLLTIVAVLAAGNAAFARLLRRTSPATPTGTLRTYVAGQLSLDIVALTLLMHFGGSLQNPFAMFFVFPIAIAGMLLPARMALGVGLLASILHCGTVVLELSGVLTLHQLLGVGQTDAHSVPVHSLWRSPLFVAGYLTAFTVTVFGVLYFVHSVTSQLREAEARRREHERVALSRERLARIGALAAGVAHTVRNPLHGIMNCVDILRGADGLSSEDQELLDLMGEGTRRIDRVTARLLVLTRDAPLSLRPTSSVAVVEDALRFVETQTRSGKVRIDVQSGPDVTLLVDPDRLSEALANVIDNAVYACRDGGLVTVRAGRSPADRHAAFVRIEDNGPGIPDDVVARVFDPFFTTKAVGEGSGLGLAIARRIIEEHGGQIDVESAQGRGTVVRIELPAAEEG